MATREQSSLDERWRAFQHLGRLRDHWYWRPGWRVGRSFYTWHLTFEDARGLHELVTDLQTRLDPATHTLVPLEGLHLTMQGVGFTDEVPDQEIAALVDAAITRLGAVPRFELALGPVDADAEGIGLLVTPWEPVERVRLAVRQAIADVWGEDRVPEEAEGFRPHVTLAYSASDATTDEVSARLAPLREVPPVTVSVVQAQLIRLNRDEHVYRWTVAAPVPLGSDGP